MRTVLVTGAFGFLGRHVSRIFSEAGYSVLGIGHGVWHSSEWEEWGLSAWHSADVTKQSILRYANEPDLIIHCAGSSSVGVSLTHPAQDFDRTVLTTREVLEYIRLHSPRTRLVFPSSASVYGNAKQNPIPVVANLHPVSPYGMHKKIAEELCISYADHFGVSSAIVRLFSLYGIGLCKQLLWDACSKLSREPSMFGGTGNETRDWLHVEDAARLLFLVGNYSSQPHFIINGGTGIGVPIRQIVDNIAHAFGGVHCACFSGESRLGDPNHLVADMSGIEQLAWQPKRLLEAEIAHYVEWFKGVKA